MPPIDVRIPTLVDGVFFTTSASLFQLFLSIGTPLLAGLVAAAPVDEVKTTRLTPGYARAASRKLDVPMTARVMMMARSPERSVPARRSEFLTAAPFIGLGGNALGLAMSSTISILRVGSVQQLGHLHLLLGRSHGPPDAKAAWVRASTRDMGRNHPGNT